MSATLNEILDDLEDEGRLGDDDALYEAFTSWAEGTGRPLYPHQEEALVEILAGNHVIAATPTGSGKSMIALAAHFTSMAHGGHPSRPWCQRSSLTSCLCSARTTSAW